MTVYEIAPRLPGISELRDLCRSLAMLEAIAHQGFVGGHESADFEANWSRGCDLATFQGADGVGVCSIVFTPAGVLICGYDHRAAIAAHDDDDYIYWPGLVDDIPAEVWPFVEDADFWHGEYGEGTVTVCLWRQPTDERWHHGAVDLPQGVDDPDGANALFHLLVDPSPAVYQRFAEESYEFAVGPQAVCEVYALRPLTQQVITGINPNAPLTGLASAMTRTGYPRYSDSPHTS